jgi:hypothetical protein
VGDTRVRRHPAELSEARALHRGGELGVDAAVLVFTSIVSIASGLLLGWRRRSRRSAATSAIR